MTWANGLVLGDALGAFAVVAGLMFLGAYAILHALIDGLTGSDKQLTEGIDASD